VAQLDCLCSFTQLAMKINTFVQNWWNIRTTELKRKNPVIEKQLCWDALYLMMFFLDREIQQLIMITGPNMSGKSAIWRQTLG
jgi:DNA mismatch repair protein MutS